MKICFINFQKTYGVNPNLLLAKMKETIDMEKRRMLLEWLYQVFYTLNVSVVTENMKGKDLIFSSPSVLQVATRLLDLATIRIECPLSDYQILGMVCLFIAIKQYGTFHPDLHCDIDLWMKVSDDYENREQYQLKKNLFKNYEIKIFNDKSIFTQILAPSPQDFLEIFRYRIPYSTSKFDAIHLQFFIDVLSFSGNLTIYKKPSLIAASALFATRKWRNWKEEELWTFLDTEATGINYSQVVNVYNDFVNTLNSLSYTKRMNLKTIYLFALGERALNPQIIEGSFLVKETDMELISWIPEDLQEQNQTTPDLSVSFSKDLPTPDAKFIPDVSRKIQADSSLQSKLSLRVVMKNTKPLLRRLKDQLDTLRSNLLTDEVL